MGQGPVPPGRTKRGFEGCWGHTARLQPGEGRGVCTGHLRGGGGRREASMGENLPGVAPAGWNRSLSSHRQKSSTLFRSLSASPSSPATYLHMPFTSSLAHPSHLHPHTYSAPIHSNVRWCPDSLTIRKNALLDFPWIFVDFRGFFGFSGFSGF